MTNPGNAIGTNAAYGGRTSANAFNDGVAAFSRGILSGWACIPSSGMKVTVGGTSSVRDVLVAEDNAGNKTSINNISASPIEVTISAAPGANTRIDAIVAYVDNPPQGTSTIVDNYEACGLIAVDGTASSSPVAPNDAEIRTAITADGASGSTAYYAVIAYITVENGTTDITAGEIEAGPISQILSKNMPVATYSDIIVPNASNPWNFVLSRCGNIVTMIISSVQEGAQGAADNVNTGTWNEVPVGFRPINAGVDTATTGGICIFTKIAAGVSSQPSGAWRVADTGKFYLSTSGWPAEIQRFAGTTSWVTTDDFPA